MSLGRYPKGAIIPAEGTPSLNRTNEAVEKALGVGLPQQEDRPADDANEQSEGGVVLVELSRVEQDVAVSILDADGNSVGTATIAYVRSLTVRRSDTGRTETFRLADPTA